MSCRMIALCTSEKPNTPCWADHLPTHPPTRTQMRRASTPPSAASSSGWQSCCWRCRAWASRSSTWDSSMLLWTARTERIEQPWSRMMDECYGPCRSPVPYCWVISSGPHYLAGKLS